MYTHYIHPDTSWVGVKHQLAYLLLTSTARDGGLKLQALTGEHRSAIVNRLADLLLERKSDIIAANQQDVSAAYSQGRASGIGDGLLPRFGQFPTQHFGHLLWRKLYQ